MQASELQRSTCLPPFSTLFLAVKSAFLFPSRPEWPGVHWQTMGVRCSEELWFDGKSVLSKIDFYERRGAGFLQGPFANH